jgi:hypothetical protein
MARNVRRSSQRQTFFSRLSGYLCRVLSISPPYRDVRSSPRRLSVIFLDSIVRRMQTFLRHLPHAQGQSP